MTSRPLPGERYFKFGVLYERLPADKTLDFSREHRLFVFPQWAKCGWLIWQTSICHNNIDTSRNILKKRHAVLCSAVVDVMHVVNMADLWSVLVYKWNNNRLCAFETLPWRDSWFCGASGWMSVLNMSSQDTTDTDLRQEEDHSSSEDNKQVWCSLCFTVT